ncbi:nucleotidyltransferase family protein [Nocardioides campestrisoli]|uniref:nucleotidyltransferase family protein n=1 Tax=Nocardioides campestrisoli TaxID=2736757 RepID=UPI0015E77852|nr:nucleotidyltransferase family protein [Nocardioides campestrisoli]
MRTPEGDDGHGLAVQAVLGDPVCRAVLERMPELGLSEWWLTAGAVFQNIWNAEEGKPPGYGIKDYDVFYFDPHDLSWEAEDRVIQAAAALFADLDAYVELRNEARVHLWYEAKFGVPATPFTSATDAIDAFASTTCCVGMTTRADGGVRVYAPHGLRDVFDRVLRPNPRLAPQEVYDAKVREYRERWPSVTAEPWRPTR